MNKRRNGGTFGIATLWLAASVGAAALSCGTDPCGGQDTFIALTRDFAGYRTWHSHNAGSGMLAGHPTGERIVYINNLPPAGSSEYPVGTIIVKEIIGDAGSAPGTTTTDLFAMVKRGCGYNQQGAVGWEFFVLTVDANGTPIIRARGIDPQSGDIYATMGGTGCNSCHAAAGLEARDWVMTPFLSGDAGF